MLLITGKNSLNRFPVVNWCFGFFLKIRLNVKNEDFHISRLWSIKGSAAGRNEVPAACDS